MAAKKTYWFKTKKYGWGWGLPLTWQGWVSFGVFIAVWLWALFAFLPADGSEQSTDGLVAFVAIMVLDVAALVYVSFKYGEPPKWNWGNKSNKGARPKKRTIKE